MTITSYDTVISQGAANQFTDPFYIQTAGLAVGNIISAVLQNRMLMPTMLKALPSLPGGASYWMPTNVDIIGSAVRTLTFTKLTLMGTLDISGASGTFTDGSAAPTITEGGTSRQIPSSILAVVDTTLNATPGSMTVTYKDQDNNTAEATASMTLTANATKWAASFLTLNSGDWGAVDITAAARSAGTTPSGIIKFYHSWPVATICINTAALGQKYNFTTDFPNLCKLGAGDQLAVMASGNATALGFAGSITYQAMA